MSWAAAAAIGLAAALDAALGEPPERWHPVAWFGRAVAPLDRQWTRPLVAGTGGALALPVLAGVLTWALVRAASQTHALAGVVAAGGVLSVTLSRRMLLAEARAVTELSTSDLPAARRRLQSLAGRDATALSPGEVRSAAVESLAENLADGLVAPLAAFALVAPASLPAAAGVAGWVKAVDTMDAMLGYRDKPVGTAAARLDDVAMWLPARVAAALLAAVDGSPGAPVAARTDAGRPPSPNSGWPMATLAELLGVRLAKPGTYLLGDGRPLPAPDDAERARRLADRAAWTAFVLAGLWALALGAAPATVELLTPAAAAGSALEVGPRW
ncbi:MAG: adenosylcobinamide-phosphate synthase CbiB [Halobacteriales archaeon]